MITVQVNDQALVSRLKELAGQLKNPRGLLVVLGREARNQLVTHFRGKERSEPNKLGGRRTHFWRKVAQSVQSPVVGSNAVTVSINHPAYAQKYYGGTIVPKRVKALTIPLSKEAYGRTASTFEHETGLKLFVIRKGGAGRGVLAAAKDGKVTVHYALRSSVTQAADPTAFPPTGKFTAALLQRADGYVKRITRNASGSASTTA